MPVHSHGHGTPEKSFVGGRPLNRVPCPRKAVGM